jgi:hypothetical protein
MSPRVRSTALAILYCASSGFAALVGLIWFAALRCDESCDGPGWANDPHAWQWSALEATSFGLFVVACAFGLSLWRVAGRWSRAILFVHTALAAVTAWGVQSGLGGPALVWLIAAAMEVIGLRALRAAERGAYAATST